MFNIFFFLRNHNKLFQSSNFKKSKKNTLHSNVSYQAESFDQRNNGSIKTQFQKNLIKINNFFQA